MTPQARAIADGFGVRLALFYAGLFVGFGIQLPFFPLWLKAKGLDAEAIGLTLLVTRPPIHNAPVPLSEVLPFNPWPPPVQICRSCPPSSGPA